MAIALLAALVTLSTTEAPAAETSPPAAAAPAVRRDFGYITMRDGRQLAYVVYRPAGQGRYPTILGYDPYIASGSPPDRLFLDHGYAEVQVNVRGTGCSQGTFGFLDAQEIEDGREVVAWIARQPWSDRNIGMYGYSYPGHSAVRMAAQRLPELKAIVVGSVSQNLYRDMMYPGGISNATFASRWLLAVQPFLARYGADARIAWGDAQCAANLSSHTPDHQEALFGTVLAHPLDDQWYRVRSLETYVGQIRVPTMISQAWQDHELTSGMNLYAGLRGPRKLFLLTGGHGDPPHQPEVTAATIRWFDRWLKREHNGIDTEPPVAVLWEVRREKNDAPTAAWTTHHDDWPVPEAKPRTFYFTGDGGLSNTRAGNVDTASRRYTFPSGTELIANNAQFALPVDPTGVLVYRSTPQPEDLTILGRPRVELFASSDNVDTDFMVVLHDVYPDGSRQYLQRGFLRASLRPSDNSGDRPFIRKRLLKRHEIYRFSMELPALGAVIRAGHSLEVEIMAPAQIGQPDWGLLPLALPGRNTVYASSAYPSALTVPVVAGAKARAPAPACGSLDFQPCRLAGTVDATTSHLRLKQAP